jgi:hypothetical protein
MILQRENTGKIITSHHYIYKCIPGEKMDRRIEAQARTRKKVGHKDVYQYYIVVIYNVITNFS